CPDWLPAHLGEARAAEGQPESKTLRAIREPSPFPKVLDCGWIGTASCAEAVKLSRLAARLYGRRKSGRRTAAVQDASRDSSAAPTSEGFGLRLSFCRFRCRRSQIVQIGCLLTWAKKKRQRDSRSPRRSARFERHTHFRRFWTAA